jgi:hypothetical protein
MVGNIPVQEIHDVVDLKIQYYPLSQVGSREIIGDFLRPFELSRAPLGRVGLIEESPARYILMIDMHHIITDGISMEILIRDFAGLYRGEDLLPLRLQYKDYWEWQRSEKQIETLKKQEDYWLKEFRGNIPVLNLETDRARPAVQSFTGDSLYFDMGSEERSHLNALAAANGVTLFMVFLALFNVLLFRLSGQKDIVVGTGAEGRGHSDLRSILGMFVNTVILRNFPSGEKTFSGFLKEIKLRTLDAFENQDYPFEDLAEKVGGQKDPSRNPLFDVMIQFETNPPLLELPDLTIKSYLYEYHTAKFDMTLWVFDRGTTVDFRWEYNSILFEKDTIQWFIRYLKEIAAEITTNPDMKLAEIGKITAKERKEKISQLTDDLENE